MKKIFLFGATGSIGESSLNVIKENPDHFALSGISFNKNSTRAKEIIGNFHPEHIFTTNEKSYSWLKKENNLSNTISISNNIEELSEFLNSDNVDIIISAISGFAGLETSILSVQTGKKVLLANKESIVAGGDILIPLSKKTGANIVPIDSEHNAILQCIDDYSAIHNITITASGGPFNGISDSDLENISPQDALKHPTWNMGAKISIDSATLVNKCLELIEASYLFNINESKINLVIHPQSIVHSIVTYSDGSSLCQMSNPDMKVPIAHALSDENRLNINFRELDFDNLSLSFSAFPKNRKIIEDLAREVCKIKNGSGIVFNAANEVAVDAFLNSKIKFLEIFDVILRTFDNVELSKELDIEKIYEIDKASRIMAKKVVESTSN